MRAVFSRGWQVAQSDNGFKYYEGDTGMLQRNPYRLHDEALTRKADKNATPTL